MFTVRKRVEVRVMFREGLDVSPGDDGVEISIENHLVGRVKRALELKMGSSIMAHPKLSHVATKIARLLEPEIRELLLQSGATDGTQMQIIENRFEQTDVRTHIENLTAPATVRDLSAYPWTSIEARDAAYARATA